MAVGAFDIIASVVLIILSGLFSGLTLGLMSLDKVGLEIVIKGGKERDAKYARVIQPVRDNGNLLLCTLLLGNVLVNSVLSIFLANLFDGVVGALLSTFLITIFGEIIPQALCSRYGLAVGAYTAWLVKIFIILTYALSWPLSNVLDVVLGREIGTIYSRNELKELVQIHTMQPGSDLKDDERGVLLGALDFSKKVVKDVMTPLDKVFMLDRNTKLDFDTMAAIFNSGHSRIPIYEGDKTKVMGLIHTKDLILVDPDDNIPVVSLLQFCGRELHTTFPDDTLQTFMGACRRQRQHLAFVKDVVNEDGKDPTYTVLGIVTLEDAIEELIGEEIVDEFDHFEDIAKPETFISRGDRDKALIAFLHGAKDSPDHIEKEEMQAICSHLSSNLPQFFRHDIMPIHVLKELIAKSELVTIEQEEVKKWKNGEAESDQDFIIYKRGGQLEYFTLLLEGKVYIKAGSEGFETEVGPWTNLGVRSLSADNPSACDFDAAATEDSIRYIKIKREDYFNATAQAKKVKGARRSIDQL